MKGCPSRQSRIRLPANSFLNGSDLVRSVLALQNVKGWIAQLAICGLRKGTKDQSRSSPTTLRPTKKHTGRKVAPAQMVIPHFLMKHEARTGAYIFTYDNRWPSKEECPNTLPSKSDDLAPTWNFGVLLGKSTKCTAALDKFHTNSQTPRLPTSAGGQRQLRTDPDHDEAFGPDQMHVE